MLIEIYVHTNLSEKQYLFFECMNFPDKLSCISRLRFTCLSADLWYCEIVELPKGVNFLCGQFFVTNSTDSESQQSCYLIKEHVFYPNEVYNIRYHNMDAYMVEINQARGIRDLKDNSLTDTIIWGSMNWLIHNARYQPSELTYCTYIKPFFPKICHRSLYEIYSNNQTYIFSPVLYASNKFTPIHEICNYQLAQLLIPPNTLYLPKTTECIIDQDNFHLGFGSLKEKINIKKTILMNSIDDAQIISWISLFDFLIVNIERNWSDHLCIDDQNRLCLLDNDMNLYHLDKFNNFNFIMLDQLNIKTKKVLYDIQENNIIILNPIKAPDYWYKVILNRINKVIAYFESTK